MVTRASAQLAEARLDRKMAENAPGSAAQNPVRPRSDKLGQASERMSPVDAAWLRMDNDANLMQIVGVWQLSPGVKYAAVCERIESALLKYERFRQRAAPGAMGASWLPVRSFDLARHVLLEKLPRSARGHEEAALQQRVAELAGRRLDRRRPLWQFHLIEDYTGPDGVRGSAMILRVHHCMADGVALISVIMALADGGAAPPERGLKDAAQDAQAWIADTLLKPFTRLTVKALDAAGQAAAGSLAMLGHPAKSLEQGVKGSLDLAKAMLQALSDCAALALMPDDAKTRLKGKPSGIKKVAWCQPIPLDEVKAVSKALDCSINDVLLSCAAGALGGYLKARGEEVAGLEIRAMVPVNLRSAEQAPQLGNHFGLAPLLLPIGMDNPVERACEVRRRMTALKGSYQPLLTFSLLAAAGLLTKPAQDRLLNIFSKKTTAVMTNVRGPREKISFCGATLAQSMFWVPQSGDVGLGVSIFSYGGGVQFGVIADSAVCPEPQCIVDEFMPEFARLCTLTLMLLWDENYEP